jgi:hypothetical protein
MYFPRDQVRDLRMFRLPHVCLLEGNGLGSATAIMGRAITAGVSSEDLSLVQWAGETSICWHVQPSEITPQAEDNVVIFGVLKFPLD